MKTIKMEEMTWPEIKAAIEAGFTTVVVGVGSTEQHGPHLPTMTDARIGDELAHRVALGLGHALHARTIAVGVSEHHLAFAGTLSVKPETLHALLRDYVDSLARHGFRRIVFLPSHGGNFATVAKTIAESREDHPGIEVTGYTDLMGFVAALNEGSAEYGVTFEEAGAHAGENETSIMMALEGDLVAADRFAPGYVGPTGQAEVKLILERGMAALTPTGVLGDPCKASAKHGERYVERLAGFLLTRFGAQEPRTPERR
ncbi:MAG: creatininase family protein [Holophagales bacterium]|nr:creatininase family protein [Holophagales bacterium]